MAIVIRLLNLAMAVLVGLFVLVLFGALAEFFKEHLRLMLFSWWFCPAVGFWLRLNPNAVNLASFRGLRMCLTVLCAFFSILVFAFQPEFNYEFNVSGWPKLLVGFVVVLGLIVARAFRWLLGPQYRRLLIAPKVSAVRWLDEATADPAVKTLPASPKIRPLGGQTHDGPFRGFRGAVSAPRGECVEHDARG